MAVYEYKEANVLARLSSALTKWRTENFLPTAFPAAFGFHHHRLVRKFPDPTNLNLVLINVWSDRPSKCFQINHFQTNRPNICVRDSLLILRIFSLLRETHCSVCSAERCNHYIHNFLLFSIESLVQTLRL